MTEETTVGMPKKLSKQAGSQTQIGEKKWQVIQMWAWAWENPKKAMALVKNLHCRTHMNPRFTKEEDAEIMAFIARKEE